MFNVIYFIVSDLGSDLLGPGVLGNEVDTDAGLVQGGRTPAVVKVGGVAPAKQNSLHHSSYNTYVLL